MTEIEDINRNIKHVRGPQGQRVVIVPLRLGTTEEEETECMCTCCVVIAVTLAVTSLILGTVFGSTMLSLDEDHYSDRDTYWTMVHAAVGLLTVGGGLIFFSFCMCKYMDRERAARRDRFMYRDSSDVHRLTEQDDEEFGFGQRYEVSSRMQNVPQPQSSAAASRVPFPGYEALPSQSMRPGGGGPSPSLMRYQVPPGRPYPAMMSYEASSQFRSSPVADRSFSPASDTTYLSQYSGAHGQVPTTPL